MSDSVSARPLAIAGDWHGNLGWSQTVVKSAARQGVSTLLHVGDLGLDWPGAKRGRYEQRLNRTLVEYDMMLAVSPGNHDCLTNINRLDVQEDGLIQWRSNVRILPKGGRTVIEGLRIGGLGGALSIDKKWRTEGKNWWADEEPTREEAEKLIAHGDLEILLSHDVPMGVPVRSSIDLPADLTEQANRTRVLLREVIDLVAPAHCFSGHWHQRVTHTLPHPDGPATRVDVLNMENSREGNCVLVWPGSTPLRIEPLIIRGNRTRAHPHS